MTYDQPELIRTLSKSLGSYMIVIDNGSTIEIPYTSIRVPENRYFSGGWNYAIPFINADWIAMLNDDIEGITLEMIDTLIEEAEREGYVAISPAFNSPHSHMQPQGKGLHQVTSIDWVAAIIRKSVWNEVGGFNSEAFPGYGSDLDLAYRLRKAGYRLGVDDRHVIHHMGGVAAVSGGTQHIQGNVTAMNEQFKKLYNVPDWMEFTRQYLENDSK